MAGGFQCLERNYNHGTVTNFSASPREMHKLRDVRQACTLFLSNLSLWRQQGSLGGRPKLILSENSHKIARRRHDSHPHPSKTSNKKNDPETFKSAFSIPSFSYSSQRPPYFVKFYDRKRSASSNKCYLLGGAYYSMS